MTEIEDWTDLDAVRNDLGEDYALANDLDEETDGYANVASGTANDGDGFDPIGDSNNKFTGEFDGGGHVIADMVVNRPTEDDVGLFGCVEGLVKNAGVVDVDVTGNALVGGLVGRNRGLIEECYATGAVTGNGQYVGGFVGMNHDEIFQSYAIADVTGEDQYNGGFVGQNLKHIEECYATGSVTGSDDVGGFVGESLWAEIDSYYDIEPNNGNGTQLSTSEMQGDSPHTEMDGFDFFATWETVEASDDDAAGEGYPILQAIDRETQLKQQELLIDGWVVLVDGVKVTPTLNGEEVTVLLDGEKP